MKRGDVITISSSGDYGKPRPAVVIQSDRLTTQDSVLVVLLTSHISDSPLFRLTILPNAANGLKFSSQIMIDKILAFPRIKCGAVIGKIDKNNLNSLNRLLSVMIGLAD